MSRNVLRAPSTIKANGFADQYKDNNASAWLWAPTHKTPMSLRTQIKSYIMECIATLVFVFCVGYSVVSAVNNSVILGIRTLIVAIVSFGSYYMVTGWLRSPEEELPRHASWNITLSHLLTLRFGLFHTLFYLLAQFVGMILAATFLFAFGPGATTVDVWIPTFNGNHGTAWGAELFATSLIVLASLYNQMGGTPSDGEYKYQRDSELAVSVVRGLSVLLFFQVGNWTFDSINYLAGLFATGFASPHVWLYDETATRLSAAFHILVPLVGMVIGLAAYLLLLFLSYDGDTKRKANGARLAATERQIHTQYVKLAE